MGSSDGTANFIQLADHIKQRLTPGANQSMVHISGGCINDCYRIDQNGEPKFFCKMNSASKYPGLFEKEKEGLEFLLQTDTIQVPRVLDYFIIKNSQVLLLEWIHAAPKTNSFWKVFGQHLAALHSVHSPMFGFGSYNYMGSLPQTNTPCESWPDFFSTRRLEPQVRMAVEKGYLSSSHAHQFEKLYSKLAEIFSFSKPSLVHGDLWSGNFLCSNGIPVLIDPAIYFGHPMVDIAMTTLFGGFDQVFYESYKYHSGREILREEVDICNLYPLLIHLNLFGRSYLGDIISTIQRY